VILQLLYLIALVAFAASLLWQAAKTDD